MTVDFSGVVPELALAVDRSADVPLGQQVQEALRAAIRAGRLRSGERLPSTRQLADQLGVSRGLVVSAYEQLLAEGYVVSAVGSGTRVADGDDRGRRPRPVRCGRGGARGPRPGAAHRLRLRRPRPACVPDARLAVGAGRRHQGAADRRPRRRHRRGRRRSLRAVLAGYHRRVRAGCADPADTIVVGGFRQGLTFVLGALAAHGIERIGLEDPGPRDHDHIARRAGLRVSAVPVDAEGVRVDDLRASGARAVLLTPAHQCPTGAVLSPTRRHELVEWAHEVDGVILEDDYDAEFRYDRQPVGSLQGLAPDRVVALGSVSKTLAPALRIGWVFTPPRFRDGDPDREVPSPAAASRSSTRRRWRGSSRPAVSTGTSAGSATATASAATPSSRPSPSTWRARPSPVSTPATTRCSSCRPASTRGGSSRRHAPQGVAVRGLGDYRVTPDDEAPGDPLPPALVIGFGNVTTRQIREGIGVLGELVAARGRAERWSDRPGRVGAGSPRRG